MKNHWRVVLVLLSALTNGVVIAKEKLVHGTKQKKGKIFMVIEDSQKHHQRQTTHSKSNLKDSANAKSAKGQLNGRHSEKHNRSLGLSTDEVSSVLNKAMISGAIGGAAGYGIGKFFRGKAMKQLSNLKVASEYLKLINDTQSDASEQLKDIKSKLADAVSQAKSNTNGLIDQLEANSSHIVF